MFGETQIMMFDASYVGRAFYSNAFCWFRGASHVLQFNDIFGLRLMFYAGYLKT